MKWLLLGLLGCGGGDLAVSDGESQAPVELRTTIDGILDSGRGSMWIQAEFDPQGSLSMPEPLAEGLTFYIDGPPRHERILGRDVITQHYFFEGPSGSYEIPPLAAEWVFGDQTHVANSSALFIDLGVEPPRSEDIADIYLSSFPLSSIWTWLILGGVGVLGGVALLWWRRQRAQEILLEEAPPEPAHVIALRKWELAYSDLEVSSEEKTQQLSWIFREYTQGALNFPATAWTTTEIMIFLRDLPHLPDGNLVRAKSLLRATDRVKYADGKATGPFFEELDSHFRAFLESTRPQTWEST